MVKFLLSFACLIFLFNQANGQKNNFQAAEYFVKHRAADAQFKDYSVFKMPIAELENHFRATQGDTEITLQLGESFTWNLDLVNSNLLSENYLLRDAEHNIIDVSHPVAARGYRTGGVNERAALTVSENFVYGFIEAEKETYYIEPLRYFVDAAAADLFIVYAAADVLQNGEKTCAVTEKHDRRAHLDKKENTDPGEKSALVCKLLELAILSDFPMFQSYGSIAAVEAHNIGVMNNVGTDYDDSFNDEIQFSIVEQIVPTTQGSDPMSTSSDIGTILDEFTAWAPGGFANTHDLGQHWSARNYDGTTIGLAWVGVVCGGFRYHVLEDFSTNANSLRVLTSHEMGHNFDQGHDASGSPFIMAPAVNNTTEWSPASVAGFNGYVPGLNCLAGCSPAESAFFVDNSNVCEGNYVRFTDASVGGPGSWNWSFPGGVPANSTEQNPVVFYQNAGNFTATLTASNSVGGNSFSQNITVGAGGSGTFFYEDFENGPGVFTIDNPDFLTTWEAVPVQGATHGSGAMFMNNYDYDAAGQRDRLISPTVDFAGRTDAVLNIEYAYTNFNTQFNDSLIVKISLDDGANYFTVFAEGETGGGTLATRPTTGAAFAPVEASDWCFAGTFGSGCISIDLSAYSSPTTRIMIENYCGFGNNMYIENVSVASSCPSFQPPVAAFQVSESAGCTPFTVQYFDNSGGSPTAWNWSFPGGSPSSSTQQNPTVVYNTPGNFSATLTVTNVAGTDNTTQNNIVTVSEGATADFVTVVNGATVDFTNLSTNGDSFFWDFGDAQSSGQINPSHTYTSEGVFPVTLTVSNDCGAVEFTENVTVEFPPVAAFSADEAAGCAPHTVTFTNESTGLNGVPNWEFPGGTPATSTQQNPTVTYADSGTYPVTLTVVNGAGEDTQTQTDFITVSDVPTADFTLVVDELTFGFVDNSTDAVSYSWNFGDGNMSSEQNPTHTYMNEGTYLVTMTVANACGTDSQEFTVEAMLMPTAPIAGFTATAQEGCEPFSVQFVNNSSADAESLFWEFPGGNPATSTQENPLVTYDEAGSYTVTLTASNEVGSTESEEINYITVNPLPTPAFTVAPDELTVTFINNSVDATSFSWTFGDAQTSNEAEPTHTYSTEGDYFVTLTATNDCGSTTEQVTVTVAVTPTAPVAGFAAGLTEGCEPFTVQFTNQSSPNAETFAWEFPGGTPATSTEENPTVTYATPGTFDVTLTAGNEVGTDASSQTDFIVVNPLPTASFNTSADELNYIFINTSTNAASFTWDFGDDNTSNEENPTHNYAAEGTYIVTLTATNDCGTTTEEIEITAEITPTAPIAGFAAGLTEGCEPFTVQFTNQSSPNAETFAWEFPGGTPATSAEENPMVTYATPGTFNVTLTAGNEVGTDASSQTDFIVVNPLPVPNFSVTANELTVDFQNTTVAGVNYAWEFGDSEISTEADPTHTYTAEGTYVVMLTASNDCGTETFTQTIEVSLTPTAPTAGFTSTATEGCAPFTVTYTNQSSANAEEFVWEFPGGTPATSTEQNPTVVYNAAGSFTATLTVSNEVGSDAFTQSTPIVISDVPAVDFSIIPDLLTVNFDNATENGTTYAWDFGDMNTSDAENPTHTYAAEGTYTVTLTAVNDCGTATQTTDITVSLAPTAPTAAFEVGTTAGCAPLTVEFTNLSTENAESYFWELEGETTLFSTDENPTFVLDAAGTYTLTLTATNEVGSDVITQTNVITVSDVPAVNFNFSVDNFTVSFTENVIDGSDYFWDFGDDETSTSQNPTHNYDEPGMYTVNLSATNDCGTTSFSQQIIVGQQAPQVLFDSDTDAGCVPFTVQFFDQSTNEPTEWNWTFPGGTPATSTEQNPIVTYAEGGEHDVILSASNGTGSNTVNWADFIEANELPEVDFIIDDNGLDVAFINITTGGTEFSWGFGDGSFSTAVSPTYTYETTGTYTVTLTATNECGTSTVEQIVTITDTNVENLSFVDEINIFPNPNDGAFTLLINGNAYADEDLHIRFVNVLGQILDAEKVRFTGSLQRSYAYRDLPAGLYFVELLAGEERVFRKVVTE